MIVDLSSPALRVAIAFSNGSSQIDVSDLVQGFTVSDTQLDGSGLIKCTGTLKLAANPIAPFSESLSPRRNPGRWARGNRVRISFEDDTRHPRGALRILKTPAPPNPENPILEIPVGCLLSLQDFRTPPDDSSEIQLGNPTARHTIINRLAAKVGIGNLIEQIPEWPIARPVPTQGGYIATMGRLAWDCGYVLWIDSQERLRAARVPLNPTTASLQLALGEDDAFWQELEAEETPCELIRAVGVTSVVKPTVDPAPAVSIASDEEFRPSEVSVATLAGTATSSPIARRRSRQPLGRIFPDRYPGSPTLVEAINEVTQRFYAETPDGLLLQERTTIRKPRGLVFPEKYPGSTSRIRAQRSLTTFTYDKDATIMIHHRVFEPAELVREPQPGRIWSGDALAEEETQIWTKTNRGWTKRSITRNYRFGATASSSLTNYSGSGNNQPPSPERREQANYAEESPVVGEARFDPVAGAAFSDRSRDFEMFAPQSVEHANEFALLEGKLLHAGQFRINWAIAQPQAWINSYSPLPVVDWNEGDQTCRYICTGLTWSHEQRRAAVAGDGLFLGRLAGGGLAPNYARPVGATVEAVGRVRASIGQAIPAELFCEVAGIARVAGTIQPEATFNFDTILTSGGEVRTIGGIVQTSDDNPIAAEIVVDENGAIATENGFVVATGNSANWASIVVDSAGQVVVDSAGRVVISGD